MSTDNNNNNNNNNNSIQPENDDDKNALFSPPFGSNSRQTSIPQATFALTNTIIGGGIMSLPYAFAYLGVTMGFIIMFTLAFASYYTLSLLVLCTRKTGLDSYAGMMKYCFGFKGQLLQLLVVLTITFLASTGYCILMKDLATPILEHNLGWELTETRQLYLMCFFAFCVVHITFLKSMGTIARIMIVSILGMMTLAGVVFYKAIMLSHDDEFICVETELKQFPTDMDLTLRALPLLLCGYTCHFNIHQLHSELVKPTLSRVQSFMKTAVLFATVLYIFVSYYGYQFAMCATGETYDNILNNFDNDDVLVNVCRGALFVVIVFAFVLLFVPFRISVFALYQLYQQSSSSSSSDSNSNSKNSHNEEEMDLSRPLMNDDVEDQDQQQNGGKRETDEEEIEKNDPLDNFTIKFFSTYLLLIIVIVAAIALGSVGTVWGLAGSLCSTQICYTFPTMIYMKIHEVPKDENEKRNIFICKAICMVSIVVAIACTGQAVYDLIV